MSECEICGKNHDMFEYHEKKANKLILKDLVALKEIDKEKAEKIFKKNFNERLYND